MGGKKFRGEDGAVRAACVSEGRFDALEGRCLSRWWEKDLGPCKLGREGGRVRSGMTRVCGAREVRGRKGRHFGGGGGQGWCCERWEGLVSAWRVFGFWVAWEGWARRCVNWTYAVEEGRWWRP